MKRIIYLTLVLSVIFTSCQNEPEFLEEKEKEIPSYLLNVPVEHQKIINQLGLDIATLVDMGDDYRLEGDIMLSKKDMNNYVYQPDSTGLKQGYVGGKLVNLIKAQNITIRIDASVPQSGTGSDWRQAVIRAINEWNNINGTCLRFVYTTASTADITVKRTKSNDNNIAWTWLPSNGIPAKEIYVNSNFDNYHSKPFALAHEMGHSIGLLHAHLTAASQGGIVVPGTPDIDNASIMSYNSDRSVIRFSNNDLIAIRRLYPADLPYLKVEKPPISVLGKCKITLTNYQAGGFIPKNIIWSVSLTKGPTVHLSTTSIEVNPYYFMGKIQPFTVTASQDGRIICMVDIK